MCLYPYPYPTLTLTLTQFDVTMGVESNRMAKVPLSAVLGSYQCSSSAVVPAQRARLAALWHSESYRVEGETGPLGASPLPGLLYYSLNRCHHHHIDPAGATEAPPSF